MKKSLLLMSFILMSCQGTRPKNLGLKDDGLISCPESPNCVSTFNSNDEEHFIKPIEYKIEKAQAKKAIESIISSQDQAQIITQEDNYIYAQYTSSIFRFVDDVEFDFRKDGLIHMRSASRIGHSDLGVNRERLEKIKFRFYQRDY